MKMFSTDYASRIWLPDCSKFAINWKITMMSQFADTMSLSNFFDVVLFLLSNLVTGPSFMSLSSLFLKLWQFSFIRDWPEIQKLKIPPSEFCPISGDWGKLGVPNLAQMSLIICYWMLQNTRVTTFTVSELLRENKQGGKIILLPTPRLGLNKHKILRVWKLHYYLLAFNLIINNIS